MHRFSIFGLPFCMGHGNNNPFSGHQHPMAPPFPAASSLDSFMPSSPGDPVPSTSGPAQEQSSRGGRHGSSRMKGNYAIVGSPGNGADKTSAASVSDGSSCAPALEPCR